jgi:hypothetical protein
MNYYYILHILILFISFIIYFLKSHRKIWESLIPGYNIYIFFKLLDIPLAILIMLGIFIIIPITRLFFTCLTIIYIPFILADSLGLSKKYALLSLVFPIIFVPFMIYKGSYVYDDSIIASEENLDNLIEESLKRYQ